MDQVTGLKGRHPLYKHKVFADFVAALNSMKLDSIKVYIHPNMKQYDDNEYECEYEWAHAVGPKT